MRSRDRRKSRAVLSSFAIALVAGLASVTLAGVGKKGWEEFTGYFQAGYVTGFTDALQIAKKADPASYLAQNFPLPEHANVVVWQREINKIYKQPKYADVTVAQAMQLAGGNLAERYGEREPPGLSKLAELIQQAREKRMAEQRQRAEALARGEDVRTPAEIARDKQEEKQRRLDAERLRIAKELGMPVADWRGLGPPVQRGFVAGFNQCVAVSRLTTPDGYVSRTYRLPAGVDDAHWRRAMRRIYDDERNRTEHPVVAMAWAGKALAERASSEGKPAIDERTEHAKALAARIAAKPEAPADPKDEN